MASGRSDRTLTYSVEIFNYCYRTIEKFLARAYYYCLCNLYQGCLTKCDCLEGARDYCFVCHVFNQYPIDELDTVERDIFKIVEHFTYTSYWFCLCLQVVLTRLSDFMITIKGLLTSSILVYDFNV